MLADVGTTGTCVRKMCAPAGRGKSCLKCDVRHPSVVDACLFGVRRFRCASPSANFQCPTGTPTRHGHRWPHLPPPRPSTTRAKREFRQPLNGAGQLVAAISCNCRRPRATGVDLTHIHRHCVAVVVQPVLERIRCLPQKHSHRRFNYEHFWVLIGRTCIGISLWSERRGINKAVHKFAFFARKGIEYRSVFSDLETPRFMGKAPVGKSGRKMRTSDTALDSGFGFAIDRFDAHELARKPIKIHSLFAMLLKDYSFGEQSDLCGAEWQRFRFPLGATGPPPVAKTQDRSDGKAG